MAEGDLRILDTPLGTDESIRLCETCKHSNYSPPVTDHFIPMSERVQHFRCMRFETGSRLEYVDLVTGHHVISENNPTHNAHCDVERNLSTATSCGERGRFWEPRTEDDQQS